MNWLDRDFWELASYIVTALGLPLALFTFVYEQRKERINEEEEVYQLLSNAYTDFLKVVIDNPDLHLTTQAATADLTPEQRERMLIIFDMLMTLFERAYLTAWQPDMTERQRRRWAVWEDFMREWLRRDDFYANFERLLIGEDPDFVVYIRRLAAEERGAAAQAA
ncbi:MAG TPA: hypothetical protein VNK91_09005 [Burkholderiaceae bacterium]|nr:hypothetical protein [Burkholderiaceae bacterium]